MARVRRLGRESAPRIKQALDWITVDLTRPDNKQVWEQLHALEPERSRIELFDMVWWMYFSPRRGGSDPRGVRART